MFAHVYSMMISNPNMWELMVPLPLPKREQRCAEEVACQLDLLTQLVPIHCSPHASYLFWFTSIKWWCLISGLDYYWTDDLTTEINSIVSSSYSL